MTSVDHVPAGVSGSNRIERLYRERGDRIRIVDTTGVDPPRIFRSEGLAEVVDGGP
jgi:hypothetical protein